MGFAFSNEKSNKIFFLKSHAETAEQKGRKKIMQQKFTKILFIFFFFLSLIVAEEVRAQNGRLSLLVQIRQLEERLKSTEEIVSSYGEDINREQLKIANNLYLQAKNQINSNRLIMAIGTIRLANFYIDLTIKKTLKNSGRRLMERLEELIHESEQSIINCQNKKAERFLIQAKENQKIGVGFIARNNFQAGLENLRSARLFAEKAAKLCSGKKQTQRDEAFDEKERFEKLLENAQQLAEENPDRTNAISQIEQALRLAEQADQALEMSEFNSALRNYYNATRILLRAIELFDIDQNSQDVQSEGKLKRELELLDSAIEQVKDKLKNEQNLNVQFLLNRTVRLRNEAIAAYETRHFLLALRKLKMAQNTIGRALGFFKFNNNFQKSNEADRQNELDQLDQEIVHLKEKYDLINNPQASKLLEMIEENMQQARKAYQQNQSLWEMEHILIAQLLVDWTEKLFTNDRNEEKNAEQIKSQLQQFDEQYELYTDEINSSEAKGAKELYEKAQKYRQTAENALTKNQFYVAIGTLKIAQQLLQKSIELIR